MGGGPHVDAPTGTFGGAPYGATKRARGVPKQRHTESRGKERRGRGAQKAEARRRGGKRRTRGAADSKRGPNTQKGWDIQYRNTLYRDGTGAALSDHTATGKRQRSSHTNNRLKQ